MQESASNQQLTWQVTFVAVLTFVASLVSLFGYFTIEGVRKFTNTYETEIFVLFVVVIMILASGLRIYSLKLKRKRRLVLEIQEENKKLNQKVNENKSSALNKTVEIISNAKIDKYHLVTNALSKTQSQFCCFAFNLHSLSQRKNFNLLTDRLETVEFNILLYDINKISKSAAMYEFFDDNPTPAQPFKEYIQTMDLFLELYESRLSTKAKSNFHIRHTDVPGTLRYYSFDPKNLESQTIIYPYFTRKNRVNVPSVVVSNNNQIAVEYYGYFKEIWTLSKDFDLTKWSQHRKRVENKMNTFQ